jgi:oxygen-dependent protoporphyrinogen oxidase
MSRLPSQIAIVGGGITGLSAAYYTQRLFEDNNIPVQITLIEKSTVLGGKIRTKHRDGFIIEQGPDSFMSRKTACTWTSSKWLHTAPEGTVLLRTYVGRAGAQEWVKLTDDQLFINVIKDLQEIMGITVKPDFYEITRLQQSMPQYPVGHLEQLKKLRQELEVKRPGIFLCGAGYQGVGIPDCIQQGKQAAEQLVGYIRQISLGQFSQ